MLLAEIWLLGLLLIIVFVSLIWVLSVVLKNAGIIDIFWGLTFVLVTGFYFYVTPEISARKILVSTLVAIWGIRLSVHIFMRNLGKPEDYRYQEFRRNYGEKRYWWFSYFQVFLLQGTLAWLISTPLAAVNYYAADKPIGAIDIVALLLWLTGFIFEAGGDWQLSRFKSNPANKGKLLQTGFWKYTRHPNYFGDAAVWWGFGLFSIAAGSWFPVFSSVLMTWLLLQVSGVAMLERTLINTKPGFDEYIKRTNSFIPWIPKKVTK